MNFEQQQQTKFFHGVMIAAGLIIIIAGLMQASVIIVPFMLAFIISILCLGAANWLEKKGMARWAALILIIVIFSLLFVSIIIVIEKSIADLSENIPSYSDKLSIIMNSIESTSSKYGLHFKTEGLMKILQPDSIMIYASDFLLGLTSLISNGFFILLAVIFILAEASSFTEKVANMPGDTEKRLSMNRRFHKGIQEYMLIKSLVSLLTGVLVGLSLWLIGVDYPLLWAILAFSFNFIPNIGSIIAAIPPILLATLQLGFNSALITACCYLVINIVVGNYIEPRFLGNKLGLSMLVVFLSLVFWGWVFGPVGMLLSVILTVKIKIILNDNEQTQWLGTLLGPNSNNN